MNDNQMSVDSASTLLFEFFVIKFLMFQLQREMTKNRHQKFEFFIKVGPKIKYHFQIVC